VLAEYTEKHHIVPRCQGGSDDLTNIVQLTPEEHYLCHQLLVKIYPDDVKLLNAALFMTANGMGKRSNKIYGWLKRRYSEYMKGPNNPQKVNPRKGERHHTFNRKIQFNFTIDGRKTLSAKMQGDNNPCAGLKPWQHPRATEYSKSVWKCARELYEIWINNGKPSYCKLYTLANKKCYTTDSKVIGPYMNVVKYFRNGWIPNQDKDWINFNE
jgi:hypothetical protein